MNSVPEINGAPWRFSRPDRVLRALRDRAAGPQAPDPPADPDPDPDSTPNTITVRPATRTDADQIATVLDVAYRNDPVSCWVFCADPDDGAVGDNPWHKAMLTTITGWCLDHGTVSVAGHGRDIEAAALWLPVAPDTPEPVPGLPAMLRVALGPAYERYAHLANRTHAAREQPTPCLYLALLGALPEAQGHGLGTALLTRCLTELDQHQINVYLEATTQRATALYQRHGFTPTGDPIQLPGPGQALDTQHPTGPALYPMRRPPATASPRPGHPVRQPPRLASGWLAYHGCGNGVETVW